MDETQFGWELYLHKSELGTADMTAIARRICEAAAEGLSTLGIAARFRPRNDIEVGGRKISGTGGAFDGDALLYQGTVLVEFDVAKMLRILRIPAEKLADKALADARERVVNLRDLLGAAPSLDEVKGRIQTAFATEFGVEFVAGELTAEELQRYEAALAEIDTPAWVDLVHRPRADQPIVEAAQKFAGGLLRAAVAYDRIGGRIRQVWFTGDVFVSPRRTLVDLESVLKDLSVDRLEAAVQAFFAGRQVDMLTLAPKDFSAVVRQALAQA
jgi:lipoate-protein ligase A